MLTFCIFYLMVGHNLSLCCYASGDLGVNLRVNTKWRQETRNAFEKPVFNFRGSKGQKAVLVVQPINATTMR